VQVETAASTTAAVAGTTFDVPLDTRVNECASDGLPASATLLRLALVARARLPGMGPGADRGVRDDVPQGLDHAARSFRPFGRSLVVVAGRAGAGDRYGYAGRPRLVRPSIRFMGVAARTEARKRRVNLARQLLRRRDAVLASRPVPRVFSQRDTGGRSTPSP
jgi:hypothetical protein